jgi:hypothetical protein
LLAFLRDAERSWQAEFESAAEERLRSIAAAASELIERTEGVPANLALLEQVKSLHRIIGESLHYLAACGQPHRAAPRRVFRRGR